jgi:hypothetical protein
MPMEKNPFEKSKQQQEQMEAEAIPANSSHYVLDSHGQPVFGASAQDALEKMREANQGYN